MGVVGQSTSAAPPVPILSKTKPGIHMIFSGDPDTTEAGYAQDGPRAGTGGDSGKMHNELLECDNWYFGADDWGHHHFLMTAHGNVPAMCIILTRGLPAVHAPIQPYVLSPHTRTWLHQAHIKATQ